MLVVGIGVCLSAARRFVSPSDTVVYIDCCDYVRDKFQQLTLWGYSVRGHYVVDSRRRCRGFTDAARNLHQSLLDNALIPRTPTFKRIIFKLCLTRLEVS